MIRWEDCAQGINNDAMPAELGDGVWSSGQNIRFRSGFAERVKGITQVFDATSVVPYFLLPYQTTSKRYWIHAGLAAIYADDGTTRTDITGTAPTGTAANKWTGGVLSGVPVLNNEADVPQYWTGNTSDNFAALTGWTSTHRCKSLRPFKQYLIAMNINKNGTKYPHMVKWSHVADPGSIPTSWDETDATKDAGEQDLAETADLLIDGMQMGDAFILYKERSMYEMRQSFNSQIFTFRRLPGEVGILAPDCVAETPVGHVVLTSGDVVVHQGQGARSIVEGKMRKWLFNQLDSTYYYRSFVVANPRYSEVWICFPTSGNSTCNMALIWNWRDDKLGVRTLPSINHGAAGSLDVTVGATWDSDSGAWDDDVTSWDENEYTSGEARLLVCKDSAIGAVDTGGQDFGTDIVANLERQGIHLGMPEQYKLLKRLYPRLNGNTSVSISFGAAPTVDNTASYSTARTYTIGTDQKVDSFANGRFLAVKIESDGAQPWKLRGMGFDVKPQGGF